MAEWRSQDRRVTPSGDIVLFTAGDWTMTCASESCSPIVVANDVTGFRWTGTIAKFYSHENRICCAETRLTELSVTLGKPKQ